MTRDAQPPDMGDRLADHARRQYHADYRSLENKVAEERRRADRLEAELNRLIYRLRDLWRKAELAGQLGGDEATRAARELAASLAHEISALKGR